MFLSRGVCGCRDRAAAAGARLSGEAADRVAAAPHRTARRRSRDLGRALPANRAVSRSPMKTEAAQNKPAGGSGVLMSIQAMRGIATFIVVMAHVQLYVAGKLGLPDLLPFHGAPGPALALRIRAGVPRE